MQKNIVPEKDLFHLAECLAKRSWNNPDNRNMYQKLAMEVEDVMQEALIVVWKLIKEKGIDNVTLPLVKKAVNWKFKNLLTDNKLITRSAEFVPIDENNEELSFTPEHFDTFLKDAELQDALTENQYNILCLRFRDGLEYHEIGDQLGQSRQAVKDAVNNAIRNIRKMLHKRRFNKTGA